MLGMEFLNPNVAGDMAELLMHDQEKFVLCLRTDNKKVILKRVPLHGDQLFEERARNTAWTFRDLNDLKAFSMNMLTGMQN